MQENIAPIFDSKALILDPQGICPPGHSHTSLQDHSNPVSHHQGLLWVPAVNLLMRIWIEMKIVNPVRKQEPCGNILVDCLLDDFPY